MSAIEHDIPLIRSHLDEAKHPNEWIHEVEHHIARTPDANEQATLLQTLYATHPKAVYAWAEWKRRAAKLKQRLERAEFDPSRNRS